MKRLIFIIMIFIGFNSAISQKVVFGILSGLESTFKDEKISRHNNYSLSLQIYLNDDWSLRIRPEYFQKKYYGQWFEREYRGIIYKARDAQLWEQSMLHLEVNRHIIKGLYLGAGVNGNLIHLKSVLYDPRWPFYYTWEDELSPNQIQDRDIKFIRLGISQTMGWEFLVWRNMYFLIEERYEIVFVGKEFGYGFLNALESISIWGGLKFSF